MAAITNENTIAGPAFFTFVPRMKKMPVPMVAPTPNIVSWKRPSERLSPESWPPGTSALRRIMRWRRGCCGAETGAWDSLGMAGDKRVASGDREFRGSPGLRARVVARLPSRSIKIVA